MPGKPIIIGKRNPVGRPPGRKHPLDCLSDKFLVGDGCWEWLGCKLPHGYGQFRTGGKTVLAHRFVYELIEGEIPEGLELDHLCRNKACVRPAHLEPVSHEVNVQRGGRWPRSK